MKKKLLNIKWIDPRTGENFSIESNNMDDFDFVYKDQITQAIEIRQRVRIWQGSTESDLTLFDFKDEFGNIIEQAMINIHDHYFMISFGGRDIIFRKEDN